MCFFFLKGLCDTHCSTTWFLNLTIYSMHTSTLIIIYPLYGYIHFLLSDIVFSFQLSSTAQTNILCLTSYLGYILYMELVGQVNAHFLGDTCCQVTSSGKSLGVNILHIANSGDETWTFASLAVINVINHYFVEKW